jgi:acetyl-CoA carboxylase carboxyl transferase subunit alpha
MEMAALKTPVVCTVIGEGGSGGALAIGIGDRILMCENAWYSVISPEGCAAILFRDASRAPEAAVALKLTAPELKILGIIDEVIPEPQGGAHRDVAATAQALKTAIQTHLTQLQALSQEQLMEKRYQKFRSLGTWRDSELAQLDAPSPRRKTKGQKIANS